MTRQQAAKKCPWNVAGISHNGIVLDAGATRTVLASEAGRCFVATGANNFTLPATADCEPGVQFIFQQIADANLVVTGETAGDIISRNNAAADTLTFSTASNKIGAAVQLELIDSDGAGTLKWLARNLSDCTMVVA